MKTDIAPPGKRQLGEQRRLCALDRHSYRAALSSNRQADARVHEAEISREAFPAMSTESELTIR